MKELPYETRRECYQEIIRTFGPENQFLKAIEEMSELTKELIKGDNEYNIAEEIADVTIMMEQLRLIYGCNEEVKDIMHQKIERTMLEVMRTQRRRRFNADPMKAVTEDT